ASDLNDELCRESCELHREVSVLRQLQLQRRSASSAKGSATDSPLSLKRAARAAVLLPRVMSHVRRAVRQVVVPPSAAAEGLPSAIEEAVRRVVVSMAEVARAEAAPASSEETAALVSEKVALKEFSLRQQERLLELELAREKLSFSMQGLWGSRLTSAFQGTLGAEPSSSSTAPPPSKPVSGGQTASSVNQQAVPVVPLQQTIISSGDVCEVVGRKGAIIRETLSLESDEVATIPTGSYVRVLEVGTGESRRARVQVLSEPPSGIGDASFPSENGPVGWLS
ncbi:unnamed protein product, partial [Polarella glacialis]